MHALGDHGPTRPVGRVHEAVGAIGVVELHEPVDMAASQATLLDHGVWLRPFGRLLYTMPPFTSTTDDVTAITTAMQAVVG